MPKFPLVCQVRTICSNSVLFLTINYCSPLEDLIIIIITHKIHGLLYCTFAFFWIINIIKLNNVLRIKVLNSENLFTTYCMIYCMYFKISRALALFFDGVHYNKGVILRKSNQVFDQFKAVESLTSQITTVTLVTVSSEFRTHCCVFNCGVSSQIIIYLVKNLSLDAAIPSIVLHLDCTFTILTVSRVCMCLLAHWKVNGLSVLMYTLSCMLSAKEQTRQNSMHSMQETKIIEFTA